MELISLHWVAPRYIYARLPVWSYRGRLGQLQIRWDDCGLSRRSGCPCPRSLRITLFSVSFDNKSIAYYGVKVNYQKHMFNMCFFST